MLQISAGTFRFPLVKRVWWSVLFPQGSGRPVSGLQGVLSFGIAALASGFERWLKKSRAISLPVWGHVLQQRLACHR